MPLLRGQVYWCNFVSTQGSEQAGRRPALVVSNNIQNRHAPIVIVAAITTSEPSKPYPFIVELAKDDPLPEKSFVLCNQLRTVSKERLVDLVGALRDDQISRVDAALKVSLALN